LRTLYLDKIERYQVKTIDPKLNEEQKITEENADKKNNVLGFISGLFGKENWLKLKMKVNMTFLLLRSTLKEEKIFPFQLYIFNPISKTYTMFLNGNRPLTMISISLWIFRLRGGKIAILKKQRRTFLTAVNISANEIPSLKERELHPFRKRTHRMNLKFKKMY